MYILGEVILLDCVFREIVNWHFHLFEMVHWHSEVEICNAEAEVVGSVSADDTIPK